MPIYSSPSSDGINSRTYSDRRTRPNRCIFILHESEALNAQCVGGALLRSVQGGERTVHAQCKFDVQSIVR
jgi:hypothetical protein